MAIIVDLADGGTVQVRAPDIGAFVQHFGARISTKGLLLETADALPRGRELELRMGLDEGLDLIEAVAMVAWTRRQAGDQPAAVGLHLLAVSSGAEFIQRLTDEREQAGRPVFDLDLASPMSEDGSPIEADQIDRMIASRGERSVAADLEVDAPEPDPSSQESEDAPDFAPGFGKSETWNQDLQAEMPQSVSSWLGDRESTSDGNGKQRAARSEGRDPEAREPEALQPKARAADPPPVERTSPAGAEAQKAAPSAGWSPPDRPSASREVSSKEPSPGGAEQLRPKKNAGGPGGSSARTGEGAEPWKSSSPEVQPPAEIAPDSGPLKRDPAPEPPPEAAKRSGPIKMKLAADRQPSGGSASESLSGALESSFVEASRRANNLLTDDHLKVDSLDSVPPESLSTVVLKPDEMKRMVDRVRDRVEAEQAEETQPVRGTSPEPQAAPAAAESRTTEGKPPGETHGATPPSVRAEGSAERPVASPSVDGQMAEADPSLLNIDRSILESTDDESFSYPQEDRTPAIFVGGIVLLIVVALILWLILT